MEKELIVTVFGSSRPREGDVDYEEARTLGRALAKHGFSVCSGGFGGGEGRGIPGAEGNEGEKFGGGAGFFEKAKIHSLVDGGSGTENSGKRDFLADRGAHRLFGC